MRTSSVWRLLVSRREGSRDAATKPFDETLDRRIWSLNAERLAWDKTLSDRRRNVPLEVEQLVNDLLDQQRAAIPTPPPEPEDFPVQDASGIIKQHARRSKLIHNT